MLKEIISVNEYSTFWCLNVPLDQRGIITSLLPKNTVFFPSIHQEKEVLAKRIEATKAPLLLVWDANELDVGDLTNVINAGSIALIGPSPVGNGFNSVGIMLSAYVPEAPQQRISVLSEVQVNAAQMNPQLSARGAKLVEQWSHSQACFAVQGSAGLDDPDCFSKAPEGRTKILVIGHQDVSTIRNLRALLSHCERMRLRYPDAYIAVISNFIADLKSLAKFHLKLERVVDHLSYCPWRPEFAQNADIVSTTSELVALNCYLRGMTLDTLDQKCLGLDLRNFAGQQAGVMVVLEAALLLRDPATGARGNLTSIIDTLDAIARTKVTDSRFDLGGVQRGIHKIEALRELGDLAGAQRIIEEQLAQDPEDASMYCYAGDVFAEGEEYAAAIDAYDKAIKINPDLPDVYAKRAQIQLNQGQMTADVGAGFKKAFQVGSASDFALLERYYEFEWERAPVNDHVLKDYQRVANLAISGASPTARIGQAFFSRLAAMQYEVGMQSAAIRNLKQAIKRGERPEGYARLHAALGQSAGLKPIPPWRLRSLKHVDANRMMFTDMLDAANGDMVIVGNGPQEMGRGLGARIDSHAMVVRFNTLNTSYPLSHDYGTKTDLWVRMPPTGYVKTDDEDAPKNIMVTGSNRANRSTAIWDWINTHIQDGRQVSFIPKEPFYELIGKLGKIPTAGLALAYMYYRETGPVDPDRIFGCSFAEHMSEGVYHASDSAAQMGSRHDFDVERAFFDTIRRTAPAHYYLPGIRRTHNNDVPTLSIDSAPATLQPWALQDQIGRYDRVISVTPGLDGYTVLGCPVEVAPRSETNAILEAPKGQQRIEPSKFPTFIGNTPPHRTLILGFGLGPTGQIGQRVAAHLGARYMCAEYGLISSCHLPSEKQFNFSLMLDDVGAFFDTEHRSRLEMILDEGFGVQTNALTARARSFMDTVLAHDITKYNNAPAMVLPGRKKGKHRILIIDQTSGDLSIKYGQCETYSFSDMLEHAMAREDAEVFFKPHPETMAGAKGANFDIAALRSRAGLTVLEENCNIMSLMPQVDEVYVMVSGVGFEALMAGKTVRCFGVPFYAGRGLTIDMVAPSRPRRPLSIEELVAGVFLQYHQFYDPDTSLPVTPEVCLERLIPKLPRESGFVHDGTRAHRVDLTKPHEAEAFAALRAGFRPLEVQLAAKAVVRGDTVADVSDGCGLVARSLAALEVFRVHAITEDTSTFRLLRDLESDVIIPQRKLKQPKKVSSEERADPYFEPDHSDRLDGLLEGEQLSLLHLAVSTRAVDILETGQGLFEAAPPKTILCRLTPRELPRAQAFLGQWYDAPMMVTLSDAGNVRHLPVNIQDVPDGSQLYAFRRE